MTVHYTRDGNRAMTEAELEMLRKAEAMPPNYDEDCPELTPEMEAAFREARRRKPLRVFRVSRHANPEPYLKTNP